jgi:hypothetical protein
MSDSPTNSAAGETSPPAGAKHQGEVKSGIGGKGKSDAEPSSPPKPADAGKSALAGT